MKMKKNWKRFFTLDRHHAEGFTLVELIVVIAILAILGGVAVPAYSGYIKKANMANDQSLISEVMHALELQYYSDNSKFSGASAVILSPNAGDAEASDEFAEAAMNAAFGASWKDSLVLSHSEWASSANVDKSVLSHFAGVIDGSNTSSDPILKNIYNGTYTPTFANDVDSLFDLMEVTAVDVGTKLETSGALLVQDAANKTTGISAAEFATYWAGQEWDNSYFMGADDGKYDGNVGALDGTVLENAVANAAVLKARNTAFAGYLRDQGVDNPEVYDYIANYNFANTVVPKDVVGAFDASSDDYDNFEAGLLEILGSKEAVDAVIAVGDTYFEEDASGVPPAMRDGLAYYAMMDTVQNVNQGNADDETYWDEMQNAVSLYGSIARGETTVEALQKAYEKLPEGVDNAVVITILVGENNEIITTSSPNVISG